MRSKWFEFKEEVINLRLEGKSYGFIHKKTNVPKSTLSNWLCNVKLSKSQLKKLRDAKWFGLEKARKCAVLAHNQGKNERLALAKNEATQVVSSINTHSLEITELALAMLYWGEGFKKTDETAMGNSDPILLNFFLVCVEKIYGLNRSTIKPELHLRADQSPEKIKKFWSGALNIPFGNFRSISIDKRTVGRKTYPSYKGVCVLRIGRVAIQRRLMYISTLFCEEIISARSSAG